MPDEVRRAWLDKSERSCRHATVEPKRAPHRSFFYAMGDTEEHLAQPIAGIAAAPNEAAPSNIALSRHARSLLRRARGLRLLRQVAARFHDGAGEPRRTLGLHVCRLRASSPDRSICLLRHGYIVGLDAVTGIATVDPSAVELADRRKSWKSHQDDFGSGALRHYVKNVGDVEKGVVTHPDVVAGQFGYADTYRSM